MGLLARIARAARDLVALEPARPRLRADANLAGSSIMGGYEGSQRNRRLFPFRPSEAAVNSLIIQSGATLRARARHLCRNNPYAHKAARVFASKLVGTGMTLVPLAAEAALTQALVTLWGDFTSEADADQKTNFAGLQTLVGRQIFEAGEVFIRFLPADPEDGLAVPLQLQILESEFCPYEYNSIAEGGNPIRAGIEFDKDRPHRRVAYWFWRNHPGEFALAQVEGGYVRVPAAEILHCFRPLRPGQIRGVSELAAAIVRAWFIDQYEDAELARKQTAALFAGFITRTADDDQSPLGVGDQPLAGDSGASINADGEGIAGLTPGILQILNPGEKIEFSNPADVGPHFEAFEYRMILALAAAMDIPYHEITGDYRQANYSSLRMANNDLKESIEQLRQNVMVFQLCRPVYVRFVMEAVLAGSLPIPAAAFNKSPRDYTRADWRSPEWISVDPWKEAQARRMDVRSGFLTREMVAAARGMSLDELDQSSARSNESADLYGLTLDSDPRYTDMRGSAPPPDQPPEADAKAEADAAQQDDEPLDGLDGSAADAA